MIKVEKWRQIEIVDGVAKLNSYGWKEINWRVDAEESFTTNIIIILEGGEYKLMVENTGPEEIVMSCNLDQIDIPEYIIPAGEKALFSMVNDGAEVVIFQEDVPAASFENVLQSVATEFVGFEEILGLMELLPPKPGVFYQIKEFSMVQVGGSVTHVQSNGNSAGCDVVFKLQEIVDNINDYFFATGFYASLGLENGALAENEAIVDSDFMDWLAEDPVPLVGKGVFLKVFRGRLMEFNITDPGTGYAVDDTITIDLALALDIVITVTAVGGAGEVTAAEVTVKGDLSSSTAELSQTSTSGIGVGFQCFPKQWQPYSAGNGKLKFIISYYERTLL
jgi:hypothetical protein